MWAGFLRTTGTDSRSLIPQEMSRARHAQYHPLSPNRSLTNEIAQRFFHTTLDPRSATSWFMPITRLHVTGIIVAAIRSNLRSRPVTEVRTWPARALGPFLGHGGAFWRVARPAAPLRSGPPVSNPRRSARTGRAKM